MSEKISLNYPYSLVLSGFEVPMSRTYFHATKGAEAIAARQDEASDEPVEEDKKKYAVIVIKLIRIMK